MKRFYKIA